MNKQRFLSETEPENINHFELRFNLIKIRGENTLVAKPQILVDGEPIKEELPVDLRDLVASLKKPGPHLFTPVAVGMRNARVSRKAYL